MHVVVRFFLASCHNSLASLEISPPAWGWPEFDGDFHDGGFDFPTRVGMARVFWTKKNPSPGFPHPRGDGPRHRRSRNPSAVISPPAWGWPEDGRRHRRSRQDFPTRVGMARIYSNSGYVAQGFPHPRGDGPAMGCLTKGDKKISPPAWGWPARRSTRHKNRCDFPTRVGMARPRLGKQVSHRRFPHPRGDGPPWRKRANLDAWISPPAWGWPVTLKPGEE